MASSAQDASVPDKKGMAEWYSPKLLAGTGVRSVISTLFGQFADKREAIAAANAIQSTPADGEFDYSAKSNPDGTFWFDYLADSGDGWNPTFAMARLVAMEGLTAEKDPRGRLLILGGDQVYPTASKEEYRDRFIGPFDYAYENHGDALWPDDKKHRPHLYAIPGNHDWYDGLNSFFGLFCRRRVARWRTDLGVSREGKTIGGRQTQQTRSYFAIQLPHDWWVWGTDSQLEGYIDQPQIDYFQHAAAYWMNPGSKVILCVADPAWAYVKPRKAPGIIARSLAYLKGFIGVKPKPTPQPDNKKFESFSYLERLAELARMPEKRRDRKADWPKPDEPMGHDLKLVLTGDSHHYCRWVEDDRNYLVCGGGGAFLHPTHHLRDQHFDDRFPKPGVRGGPGSYPRDFSIGRTPEGKEALFPDRATSAGLAIRNFLFAWKNKKFVVALMCIYGFFNWILDFNSGIAGHGMLVDAFRDAGWIGSFRLYWTELVWTSPWSALLVAISLVAYIGFAESPFSTGLKIFMGAKHAVAQAFIVTLTTIAVILWTDWLVPNSWPRLDSIVSIALATIAAAIMSATVFGSYLWFWIRWFRRHPNEGFSSMAIEGYKSFLRLRIDKDGGLTIFPVGLKEVPKNDDKGALNHHLIEPPIRIS